MTTIIGLDLGKFNSAACTFLTGDGEVRFQSLPTRIAALRQLFEREQPDLVVFEACAQAGFTADLCRELGLKFLVANTNGEAWKWKNVKRKTDRDDALKLARLAYLGELPTVELPETATRQRRAFLNFRQLLVSQRVQLQNHLRSVLVAQGLEAPRGHHAWTAAGLEGAAYPQATGRSRVGAEALGEMLGAAAARDDLARAGPAGRHVTKYARKERSEEGSEGCFGSVVGRGEGPRQLVAKTAFSNGRLTSSARETRPNEGATRRMELVSPGLDPTMNGP